MRNWKIDNILSLLKEAGALALASWSSPQVELKADQTVVTNADRAIEQRFAEAFDRPAAGSFMIGEESVGTRTEEYLDEALRLRPDDAGLLLQRADVLTRGGHRGAARADLDRAVELGVPRASLNAQYGALNRR